MKIPVMTLLLTLLRSPFQRFQSYRKASTEILRLKMSLLYLKTIETSRLLFVSLLEIGISLVFLLVGLILFHAVIFLYAPWEAATKFYVGMGFAMAYLLISFTVFFYIFSQSKWLMIFHAENLLKDLEKQQAQALSGETPEKNQSPLNEDDSNSANQYAGATASRI